MLSVFVWALPHLPTTPYLIESCPVTCRIEGWIPALTLSRWVSRGFCPEAEAAEVVYLIPTSGPLSLHYASSKWKISSRFDRPDWEWRDRSCRGRNLKQFGITSHILIWVMLPTTAGIIKKDWVPWWSGVWLDGEQGSVRLSVETLLDGFVRMAPLPLPMYACVLRR